MGIKSNFARSVAVLFNAPHCSVAPGPMPPRLPSRPPPTDTATLEDGDEGLGVPRAELMLLPKPWNESFHAACRGDGTCRFTYSRAINVETSYILEKFNQRQHPHSVILLTGSHQGFFPPPARHALERNGLSAISWPFRNVETLSQRVFLLTF